MNVFMGLLNEFNIEQLKDCRDIISNTITARQALSNSPGRDIHDVVDYHNDFLSENTISVLNSELMRLNLSNNAGSGKAVQNAFLSTQTKDPYVWNSRNGRVVNNPINIKNFPTINSIMERINNQFHCNLNSVLVSYYGCGNVGTRLHSDAESVMNPSEPICVVSLGARRLVDFVSVKEQDYRRTCLTLSPADGSVYIMKPGCQDEFLHRVRRNKNISQCRFSLSFRSFTAETSEDSSDMAETSASPVKNLIQKFDSKSPDASFHSVHSAVSSSRGSEPLTVPQNDGYSPFPADTSISSSSTAKAKIPHHNPRDKICVIFGTSITTQVDENRMGSKSRQVINCSLSGAKIEDISDMARDFCVENSALINKIDKVVVSVGNNDIKYFNGHRFNVARNFAFRLHRMIDTLKFLFPYAMIVFQTVLPIRVLYKYTGDTFHAFNRLLRDICGKRGCIFFDCFAEFLDSDGDDINAYLYRDRLHLNTFGLQVLCRALKYVIHRDVFNPIMRESCSPFYYC